jgi:hypothetical protein
MCDRGAHVVVVWQTLPRVIQHTHLSSQRENPRQVKVQMPPKSNLLNQELYWGYLREYGWWVTCRNRNDSKTAASPMPTPAWMPAHKAGNREPTAQPASILSSQTSGALTLFQAAWLASASSRQLVWPQTPLFSFPCLGFVFFFFFFFFCLLSLLPLRGSLSFYCLLLQGRA